MANQCSAGCQTCCVAGCQTGRPWLFKGRPERPFTFISCAFCVSFQNAMKISGLTLCFGSCGLINSRVNPNNPKLQPTTLKFMEPVAFLRLCATVSLMSVMVKNSGCRGSVTPAGALPWWPSARTIKVNQGPSRRPGGMMEISRWPARRRHRIPRSLIPPTPAGVAEKSAKSTPGFTVKSSPINVNQAASVRPRYGLAPSESAPVRPGQTFEIFKNRLPLRFPIFHSSFSI